MTKGLLIVYSGPSGVGKNTVREQFFHKKELRLVYSVSMTTRPIRPGERDGIDYFFVSDERFDQAVANDELLEHAEFVGCRYGTPKWFVEEQRQKGRNVLLEIEVQGALQVMSRVADCLTIFLVPPSLAELERRLRARATEDDQKIARRLLKAAEELRMQNRYQHVIVNDDAGHAAAQIAAVIAAAIKERGIS